MKQIKEKIWKLIFDAKDQGLKVFGPLHIDFQSSYEGALMQEIIDEFNNNFEVNFKEVRPLLAKERLGDISHRLQFIINTCLSNGKGLYEINNILADTLKIEIEESEFTLSTENTIQFIQKKINYNSDLEIEVLLKDRIDSYKYAYPTNKLFNLNQKTFVIITILISSEATKLFDPKENISNDFSSLIKFYANNGIDIMSDKQFSKYNLVSVNENFELPLIFPPRIFDQRVQATIFLSGIEDYLFRYLKELKHKYKFDLALKASPIFIIESIYKLEKIEEHLEKGKYFDLESINGELITKLYNDEYDTFWVVIDNENVTFEEIINDFDVFQDMIVTQVIHSEYSRNQSDIWITHLDHEYIFYTLEEFENRQSDPYQKGEARKRIKTFKIDNAMIPVTEKNNIFFHVVLMKFLNKELIVEYFNKVEAN